VERFGKNHDERLQKAAGGRKSANAKAEAEEKEKEDRQDAALEGFWGAIITSKPYVTGMLAIPLDDFDLFYKIVSATRSAIPQLPRRFPLTVPHE
jgi:hypothetical protein